MHKGGCVYIITNENNTTLYTGVTSDLKLRIWQHKTNYFKTSFSSKYNLKKLVYCCFYNTIDEAILIEKKIKAGSRLKKEELINNMNPTWIDLYDNIEW
jgi:putative endonuclease